MTTLKEKVITKLLSVRAIIALLDSLATIYFMAVGTEISNERWIQYSLIMARYFKKEGEEKLKLEVEEYKREIELLQKQQEKPDLSHNIS